MIRTGLSIWTAAVCGIWAAGCGISAPKTPDGAPIELLLLVDDGIQEAAEPSEQEDRRIVANWMKTDVSQCLTEGGYAVRPAKKPADFIPTPNVYLVVVTLDVLKTSEIYIQKETRLGEGITTVTATVELFKDNHTIPILRYTESFISSRDWTYTAEELDRKMVEGVSDRIHELY